LGFRFYFGICFLHQKIFRKFFNSKKILKKFHTQENFFEKFSDSD